MAFTDFNIYVSDCIASTDLWAFGIKSHGEGTTRLNLFGLFGMVDD